MRQLWFFVEGENDEDFIRRVIMPRLQQDYSVQVWRYARRAKEDRRKFIESLSSPSYGQIANYWILADMDRCACFTECRNRVIAEFDGAPAPNRIVCVNRSIEAWYVAGFTGAALFRKLQFGAAEGLHKSDFDQSIRKLGYSPSRRSEILMGMLQDYNLELARQRSPSLDYFCRKLGL